MTRLFLLDTNICAYLINRRPTGVYERLLQHHNDGVSLSSLTVAELRYGAAKSSRPAQNHGALDEFLVPLSVSAFDAEAAAAYGRIRVDLERRGLPIGPLDTLIAAHALSLGAVLVTNSVREFARVPGLRVENWADA